MASEWEELIGRLIESGKEREALHMVNSILQKNSTNFKALYHKANLHYSFNELKPALKTFLKLYSLHGEGMHVEDQIIILDYIAMIYSLLNAYNKAISYYKMVISEIENNMHNVSEETLEMRVLRMYYIAEIFEMKKEYKNALNYYQKLIQIHTPNNNKIGLFDVYYSMGSIHLTLNKFYDAKESFLQAKQNINMETLLLEKAYLNFKLGRTCYHLKEYSQAEQYLKTCLKLFKKDLEECMLLDINIEDEIKQTLLLLKKINKQQEK